MADLDKVNDLSSGLISFVNAIINILLEFIDIDNATGSFFDIFIDIFDSTDFRWMIFIAIVGLPIVVFLMRARTSNTGGIE